MHSSIHVCACSVTSDSLQPCGLQPARLLCPWDSLGKNTGMGCYDLFQGDLPNSGIRPESLMLPALAGGFFTTSSTWEAPNWGSSRWNIKVGYPKESRPANLTTWLFERLLSFVSLGLSCCSRAFSGCSTWTSHWNVFCLLQSTGSRHAGSVVVALWHAESSRTRN